MLTDAGNVKRLRDWAEGGVKEIAEGWSYTPTGDLLRDIMAICREHGSMRAVAEAALWWKECAEMLWWTVDQKIVKGLHEKAESERRASREFWAAVEVLGAAHD